MTAADNLRELLATRPAMPNTEELTRWWHDSVRLVPTVLLDLEALDCDLVAARAALRREQDARAELRVELDRERVQHRTNVEGFQSALAQEAHEKSILEQVECELRAEANAIAVIVGIDPNEHSERSILADAAEHIRTTFESHRRLAQEVAQLSKQLDARIAWQVSAVAHLRAWSGLFDAAVEMHENHEGCITEPPCGDCFRCRFDAAVDEAMKAVAANSPTSIIADAHPSSWLDCPECRSLSKAGAEPPRCAAWEERAQRERMEAGHA